MAKIKGWKKINTDYPLVSNMASDNIYKSNNNSWIKITNIMMDTNTPYWVTSSEFPIREFRTKKQAIDFAIKYMRLHSK